MLVTELNNLQKALYITICSRGPGTETIVVQDLLRDPLDDGEVDEPLWTLDDLCPVDCDITKDQLKTLSDGSDRSLELDERMVQLKLNEGKVVAGELDEGPVYLMPKGMSEKDFMAKIMEVERRLDEGNWSTEHTEKMLSAILRAVIVVGEWTSVGAWRKLDHELLTKEHLEKYMEVMEVDTAMLLTHHCPVLRRAAELYEGNNSPKVASGC